MIGATPNTQQALDDAKPLLAVVDPISTGATLAGEADKRGMKVLHVWSDVIPASLMSFVAEGQSNSSVGAVRLMATTLTPLPASALLVAQPMPLVPPNTSAFLPPKSKPAADIFSVCVMFFAS